MADAATLERWRDVVDRLRRGPAPQGESFDLCRRLIDTAADAPETASAVRMLLEGAMADALTDTRDSQAVMSLLKALDRTEVRPGDLVSRP